MSSKFNLLQSSPTFDFNKISKIYQKLKSRTSGDGFFHMFPLMRFLFYLVIFHTYSLTCFLTLHRSHYHTGQQRRLTACSWPSRWCPSCSCPSSGPSRCSPGFPRLPTSPPLPPSPSYSTTFYR